MTRPETFIITGMHRSGTSLVARFLHLSGVDMGKEWIDPNEDNPLGYFEDADFVSLHQRILARNNPTRDQVMWIKN